MLLMQESVSSPCSRVTGGADGFRQVHNGVPVTVQEHTHDVDEVPGRLPLAPATLPAAAVESGKPGDTETAESMVIGCTKMSRLPQVAPGIQVGLFGSP